MNPLLWLASAGILFLFIKCSIWLYLYFTEKKEIIIKGEVIKLWKNGVPIITPIYYPSDYITSPALLSGGALCFLEYSLYIKNEGDEKEIEIELEEPLYNKLLNKIRTGQKIEINCTQFLWSNNIIGKGLVT